MLTSSQLKLPVLLAQMPLLAGLLLLAKLLLLLSIPPAKLLLLLAVLMFPLLELQSYLLGCWCCLRGCCYCC
jgi:hypothetical protein